MGKNLRKRTRAIGLLFLASMLPVLFPVLPAGAQSTSGEFSIAYSFNEVRSALLRTKVVDFDTLGTITTITGNSYHASRGSFKVFTSLPFNIDANGVKIPESQALASSKVITEKKFGETWIEYREFYYGIDLLLYSDLLLPPLSDITIDDVQMPGWRSAGNDKDESDGNINGHTVDDTRNFLLVLEETAPKNLYNTFDYPTGTVKFRANTPGFTGDEVLYGVIPKYPDDNEMEFTQTFEYNAKSINMDSIHALVGGERPLIVKPEISITLKPFLTRVVNISSSDVSIYSAITSVQCMKNVGGVIQDTYSANAQLFSATVSANAPPSSVYADSRAGVVPSQGSGVAGGAGDRQGENPNDPGRQKEYTATCTVDPTPIVTSIPSRQEGVQVGVPLAMYYADQGTQLPSLDETSDIRLIKDAPTTIRVIPEMVIQPNWFITKRTVNGYGLWVDYRDPWLTWTGVRVYDDPADTFSTYETSIEVNTKVDVENIYVMNRFKVSVIVASVVNTPVVLTSGGEDLTNATLGGVNSLRIADPRNASSSAVTPEPVTTWWEDAQSKWEKFWSDLGLPALDLNTVIIIVIIVIAALIVLSLLLRRGPRSNRTDGGYRRQVR